MNKTKILIVEDEAIVALDIKRALTKLDFNVSDTVSNYNDALKSFQLNKPDLVILDINLSNSKNGIETAKAIQKIKDIPILYLTAFCDDETINEAIKTNPIGYLIKPFKREELKSTILLGLYKIANQDKISYKNTNSIQIGHGYSYNLKKNELKYKDIIIKINSNEKKLLLILIKAKGEVVSFEEIEHKIWPETSVSNSTLRTLLYRLRSKLEYKIIETIPTIGCKLNLSD